MATAKVFKSGEQPGGAAAEGVPREEEGSGPSNVGDGDWRRRARCIVPLQRLRRRALRKEAWARARELATLFAGCDFCIQRGVG